MMEGLQFPTPAQDPSAIAFDLPPPSLRVFFRAVQCIGKLGREVTLIFRPEELVLHGTDDARAWIIQFALRRKFFKKLPGEEAFRMKEDGKATAVVPARSLLVAVRGAEKRAENLQIGLCQDPGMGEKTRLGLEFVVRHGARIRHRVPLLDSEVFLPRDPPPGAHTAAFTPNLVTRLLDHCTPPSNRSSSCEEVTIAAVADGLKVSSVDLLRGAGTGNRTSTDIMIQKTDLEACVLDPRGGEVVFSGRGLREFAKVFENTSRDLEAVGVGGAPLLELRFGPDTSSVVCRLVCGTKVPEGRNISAPSDVSAVLLIATRDLQGESEPVTAPEAAATPCPPPSTPAGRRPQPKQGSKRRAVAESQPTSFDLFPDHSSQASRAAFPATPPVAGRSLGGAAPPTEIAVTTPQVQRPASQGGPMVQTSLGKLWPRGSFPPATLSQASTVPGIATVLPAGNPGQQPQHTPAPAAPARNVNDILHVPTPCNVQQQQQPPPQAVIPQQQPRPQQELPRPQLQPPQQPRPPAQQQHQQAQSRPQQQPAPMPAYAAPRPAPPPAGYPPPVMASQLLEAALDVCDSDGELIGADPDEVAFAPPQQGDESVDWLDVDKLW
mmetsp:Transcript_41388/g.74945  ORF Transcript_41388/g.74945 Transcript_41388/m.74945 type:complete len:607 (-) Transcript_41388:208-2028(-)